MVVSRLIGGIGNQMFQYAAGRRLAYVLGVDLKLDSQWFRLQKLRKYDLGCFNSIQDFASKAEILALTFRKRGIIERGARRLLRKEAKLSKTHITEKKYFNFDPEILRLSDGVYLDGYWQSEKYFMDIAKIIRKEFIVKEPPKDYNKQLLAKITDCESVSIHFRRGDYVSDQQKRQTHGSCSLDYYLRAIKHIIKSIPDAYFFMFSDDPQWVYDNMKLDHPITIVDQNGPDKSHEDLRLMSQCKHNIIANSTFSWWGAWLNENPDKIVIAPKKWFNKFEGDTKDLIPQRWITF